MRIAVVLLAAAAMAQSQDIQDLLDDAVRTGAQSLSLPEGRVRVDGRLLLQNAVGLTIEGSRTTLVFSDHSGTGWSINGCRNLILRGFSIDHDPVPFVQGRFTGRSNDGKRYDFTVAEEYPGLDERDQRWYRQASIFDAHEPR